MKYSYNKSFKKRIKKTSLIVNPSLSRQDNTLCNEQLT